MFNSKKIKELGEEIKELKSQQLDIVKDQNTGFLILKSEAVEITIKREVQWRSFSLGCYWDWETRGWYFKKGTEPKCDYIEVDRNGKITYYKNGVSCNKNGKVK